VTGLAVPAASADARHQAGRAPASAPHGALTDFPVGQTFPWVGASSGQTDFPVGRSILRAEHPPGELHVRVLLVLRDDGVFATDAIERSGAFQLLHAETRFKMHAARPDDDRMLPTPRRCAVRHALQGRAQNAIPWSALPNGEPTCI
jgi:hypothetical protein